MKIACDGGLKPSSDREMRAIERDPARLRGYFWRVAMNARRIAAENRRLSQETGIRHPTTNYRAAFAEGRDLIADAEWMDRFSAAILKDIDLIVETTLVRSKRKSMVFEK
jgi:hypothetical protein